MGPEPHHRLPRCDPRFGHHQAIRHKIAEMAVRVETGRALTYNALRMYHEGQDAVKEVTMAKLKTQRVRTSTRFWKPIR